jgi:ABC-2 type transport system permease protein
MFGLKKLFSLIELHFKSAFIYRADFMASIIITPLMLIMQFYIWQKFFDQSSLILGYTFDDIMKYYIIINLIGHFIYNQVGSRIQQKIIHGDLNQHLLKPISVLQQLLSQVMAFRILAFFVEVLPIFILVVIFLNLNMLWYTYIFVLIAMIFSFFINFFISYLIGLLSFWLYKSESFQWLTFWAFMMLSGQFVPLEFFGETFFMISKYMPFYYLRYGVAQIFLNKFTIDQTINFISIQLIWIIILYEISRFLWNKALKKYGAVGG